MSREQISAKLSLAVSTRSAAGFSPAQHCRGHQGPGVEHQVGPGQGLLPLTVISSGSPGPAPMKMMGWVSVI